MILKLLCYEKFGDFTLEIGIENEKKEIVGCEVLKGLFNRIFFLGGGDTVD